jgi:hypothetical protein
LKERERLCVGEGERAAATKKGGARRRRSTATLVEPKSTARSLLVPRLSLSLSLSLFRSSGALLVMM